jgi:hypothetical protein
MSDDEDSVRLYLKSDEDQKIEALQKTSTSDGKLQGTWKHVVGQSKGFTHVTKWPDLSEFLTFAQTDGTLATDLVFRSYVCAALESSTPGLGAIMPTNYADNAFEAYKENLVSYGFNPLEFETNKECTTSFPPMWV